MDSRELLARGGTRTRTGLLPRDFKSLVSTISPPEQVMGPLPCFTWRTNATTRYPTPEAKHSTLLLTQHARQYAQLSRHWKEKAFLYIG